MSLASKLGRWFLAPAAAIALAVTPAVTYAQNGNGKNGKNDAKVGSIIVGIPTSGNEAYTGKEAVPILLTPGVYKITTAHNTDSDPKNDDYVVAVDLSDAKRDLSDYVKRENLPKIFERRKPIPQKAMELNLSGTYLIAAYDATTSPLEEGTFIRATVIKSVAIQPFKQFPVGDINVGPYVISGRPEVTGHLELPEGTYPVDTTDNRDESPKNDDYVSTMSLERLWREHKSELSGYLGVKTQGELTEVLQNERFLERLHLWYVRPSPQKTVALIVNEGGQYLVLAYDAASKSVQGKATLINGPNVLPAAESTAPPVPEASSTPAPSTGERSFELKGMDLGATQAAPEPVAIPVPVAVLPTEQPQPSPLHYSVEVQPSYVLWRKVTSHFADIQIPTVDQRINAQGSVLGVGGRVSVEKGRFSANVEGNYAGFAPSTKDMITVPSDAATSADFVSYTLSPRVLFKLLSPREGDGLRYDVRAGARYRVEGESVTAHGLHGEERTIHAVAPVVEGKIAYHAGATQVGLEAEIVPAYAHMKENGESFNGSALEGAARLFARRGALSLEVPVAYEDLRLQANPTPRKGSQVRLGAEGCYTVPLSFGELAVCGNFARTESGFKRVTPFEDLPASYLSTNSVGLTVGLKK